MHEGFRSKPYVDTTGHLTIGYGRNLTDKGISDEVADLMLEEDIAEATAALYSTLPWVRKLSAVRQVVLIDMCFNMGLKGLLSFRNMLRYAEQGNHEKVVEHMLSSKWARQVKTRATRLAEMWRTNSYPQI